jgi:enoyl-CoA hydratase/carnithine racemase
LAYETMIYEKRDDHISVITINRPERRNALDSQAQAELGEIWQDFNNDPEQWVAILTGAGDKAFCAGADLRAVAAGPAAGAPRPAAPTGPTSISFGGLTKAKIYKPIIAAVNGFALGGGCEMVLACDIVIAAEHAELGLPEPKRGLIAAAGGVLRFPRQLPYHIAMEYVLTGEHIRADLAQQYGLVNRVVPMERLMDEAMAMAQKILENAPTAVRAAKEIAVRGLELPLVEGEDETSAWDVNDKVRWRNSQTEDYKEGPRAFAEKRKPQWKGR